MAEPTYRIERDSMGEIQVPANALYSAQTQRAVAAGVDLESRENFLSARKFHRGLNRRSAALERQRKHLAVAGIFESLRLVQREKFPG